MPDASNAPVPAASRLATSLGSGPSPMAAAAQAQVQQLHAHQAQQAAQAQQSPAAGGGERRCRICATVNGPTLRYCTSCGSTLDAPQAQVGAAMATVGVPRMVEAGPAAPMPLQGAPIAPSPASLAATALANDHGHGAAWASPPAPAPAPAPQPMPAAPAHAPPAAPAAPIAPMRVVELGTAARVDSPRICNRCRGVVDGAAQFCKFCGASLAESAAQPAATPFASPGPSPVASPVAGPVASPGLGPVEAVPPLAPHERLELPRTNGFAHGAARPPTVPMQQPDPPTPFAAFPPPGMTPPPAPVQARGPAPGPAPAHDPAPAPVPVPVPPPVPPSVARPVVRGRLVVIAKSGADGPSYPIGDSLDVGRTEGQIVVGEDPYLSPRHVRIAWTGSKLVLRDLASTNGVYIRLVAARDMNAGSTEKQASPAGPTEDKVPGEVAVPLHDQDLILVGQQVLRFESATAGSQGDAGFGPATEHGTLLFGSPAAKRYARLSQRTVEGVTRDVYYVRKVETVLGRESGDVVFTEDPFLSRRHAAIRVLDASEPRRADAGAPAAPAAARATRFALVDLGSSNGSFLRIRGEIDLVAGDHFRVGQQLFRVDFESDALIGRAPG